MVSKTLESTAMGGRGRARAGAEVRGEEKVELLEE